MKCDELEEEYLWTNNVKTPSTRMVRAYNADDVDKAIAELKARIQLDDDEMAGFLDLEEECGGGDLRNYIAELKQKLSEKDKRLDVKDFAHVLKAFKFYLCQLTHCAYDERTAQWIIDNWEQDYDRVEEYKG